MEIQRPTATPTFFSAPRPRRGRYFSAPRDPGDPATLPTLAQLVSTPPGTRKAWDVFPIQDNRTLFGRHTWSGLGMTATTHWFCSTLESNKISDAGSLETLIHRIRTSKVHRSAKYPFISLKPTDMWLMILDESNPRRICSVLKRWVRLQRVKTKNIGLQFSAAFPAHTKVIIRINV